MERVFLNLGRGLCVCPCVPAQARSEERIFGGGRRIFDIIFWREGAGSGPHASLGQWSSWEASQGPRERGALNSRGARAAARPPPVSRVLQGGLCVCSSSPRRAGGDAGGDGPGIPPTLVLLTVGCPVNSLFWADLKTFDFPPWTPCTLSHRSHQPCFEEKPASHLWPTSGARRRLWP